MTSFDLLNGDWWGTNPHDDFAWMRANGPIHFDEKNKVWGVSRFDDVKAVSSNPTIFSNAGGIRAETGATPMMIDMDDPGHARRRKLVNKGFTPRRVRDAVPRIRSIVDKVLDDVCERGECDFVTDIAAWLPLIVIGDALGFGPADYPTLLEWSDDLVRGLGQDDPVLQERTTMAAIGYSQYIQGVIATRRAEATDDLVSVLVDAEIEGDRLDDEQLMFETLLLLIGGDETTRHVLTGGLYQLLVDRSRWDAVREDRSLLPSAIEEMLRWVSPVRNMARQATADVELGGKRIAKGEKLLLLYPSANRDAAHFDDPMTFDLRRSPNDHIAFGFGTHFCLGSALARQELFVMFDRLLDRLPDLDLVDLAEPPHRPANFVSGYENMPVHFSPTRPLPS